MKYNKGHTHTQYKGKWSNKKHLLFSLDSADNLSAEPWTNEPNW